MGVVCLNLGERDAFQVQRALATVVAGCPCWQRDGDDPCDTCQSLGAVVAELHRCLARGSANRPRRLACGQLGDCRFGETVVVQIDPLLASALLSGHDRRDRADLP